MTTPADPVGTEPASTQPASTEPNGTQPAGDADPFGDSVWQLVAGSVDSDNLALLDTHPITITSDGAGNVGGSAACNSYGGTYTTDANDDGIVAIAIGAMSMTEMACQPDEVNQLESAYVAALARVTTARSDGEVLTLTGTGVELSFEAQVPAADASLTGTTWMLESLVSGGAVSSGVSSTVGTEATLTIGAGGSVSGTTGCNGFDGALEIVDDRFGSSEFVVTDMACEPAVMDQEDAVLTVLGGGPTWAIDGDLLSLQLDDGSGLVYRARTDS
jgi:heat shock protein HslJ